MKNYKNKCLEILKNIKHELSDIRDEIEVVEGYESKLDKEARSIEKKINKFIEHLMEDES